MRNVWPGTPIIIVTNDRERSINAPTRTQPRITSCLSKVLLTIALPTIIRPVVIDDHILIDGGATNPLPFDLLRGRADVVVAVEISGPPSADKRKVPNAIECLYATVLVVTHSLISEKLKHGAPDLFLQPNVGSFRVLDFLRASAILRVAEPVKDEVKQRLSQLIDL